MIGSTFSHYTILEKLGEGGMGVVYKARDTKLDRTVAIKFLPRRVATSATERARFTLEARAAAALNHPNIATIHAIEEVDDETFIVMEYVEGEELKQRIARGALPVKEAVLIGTRIAEGLQAAHRKEIVHRDIKSANIMLTAEGHVKVMDFGLAKVRGSVQVTREGTTLGTAAYMSPEQARGEEVDARTDIWSFGVVLYEMITGRLPFRSDYDQAVTYAILHEDPEPVSALRPDVPAFLQDIVARAMKRDREERYQDMGALLRGLQSGETENRTGASHAAPGVSERSGGPDRSAGLDHAVGGTSDQGRRRRILVAVAAGVVAIVVAAVLWRNVLPEGGTPPGSGTKRLAVLPLQNLGPAEQEYFADGLTGEITSKLSGISGLSVIARSSAMQYKNTDKSLKQIAEELKVDYILEGTLQWAESAGGARRIRVSPELIRVADATQVWSRPYEADFSDAFALQVDIASTVAGALNITLGSTETETLRERLTENPEAYDVYLSALSYADDINDERGLRIAEQLYTRAIRMDNRFAAAYAGLSNVQSNMYWMYFERTEKNRLSSRENAKRALELDPGLPLAHATMGDYYYHGELEYDAAVESYQEAIRLQPNNVQAISGIGFVRRRQGDMRGAVEFLEKAMEFDPRDYATVFSVGETYVLLREYDRGIPLVETAISILPEADHPYAYQAWAVLLRDGDTQGARNLLQSALGRRIGVDSKEFRYYLYLCDLMDGNLESAAGRFAGTGGMDDQFYFRPEDLFAAQALDLMNNARQAREAYGSASRVLEKRIEQQSEDPRLHSSLGLVYAGLGRKAEAVRAGKRGVELMPIAKEAWRGAFRLLDLAQIYTMVGEPDPALDALEKLLGMSTDAISAPLLRLDPTWAPLRNHPRFQDLLKKHSGSEG